MLAVSRSVSSVGGVGFELLSEGHRHGVLKLRAAHLDDAGELLALGVERRDEFAQRGHQFLDAAHQCDPHGRGVGVVGRLREVDVVVGVAELIFALFMAEEFERPVGDHLVGVHVGRCAGAALHHVDDELLLEFPGAQLLAGPDDRVGDRRVEQSQVAVGHRGALLDVGQGADQLREEVEPHAADVEILHRAHGLHAEIILRRDFHFAQQIVFTTGFARKSDFRKVHDRYVFIKGTQKRGGVQAESGTVR